VCELDGPIPILNSSKRLCFTRFFEAALRVRIPLS
jgi:hypothetical protein